MVVGIIPESAGKILLCRRAIEPQLGKWTFPAGYLENGETVSQAARRETLEEAGAEVEDLRPYAMFSLPHINQVYFIFLARLSNNNYGPGSESLEVKLYRPEDIPWSDLAFTSVVEALRLYDEDRKSGVFSFRQGDIFPPRGARTRRHTNV
jgi:ADP-ribose pyrophosphatase YjhB (NUDIX family)